MTVTGAVWAHTLEWGLPVARARRPRVRKRIAAAVLAAFVNILGAANADALVVDDDDGPDGIDSIEFGKAEEAGPHAPGAVAAAAAAAVGEPLDAVWVARTATGARAAVTVQHRSA